MRGSMKITELINSKHISSRTAANLRALAMFDNITTVEQLCELTPRRFKLYPNFGDKTLYETRRALAEHKLTLKDDKLQYQYKPKPTVPQYRRALAYELWHNDQEDHSAIAHIESFDDMPEDDKARYLKAAEEVAKWEALK